MSETNTLITIEATIRTGIGKSYTRKLRKAGKVPGIILSKGKTTMIEFDPKLLPKAYKASKTFSLKMDGGAKTVKIHELHVDPVSRAPLHVDLVYV